MSTYRPGDRVPYASRPENQPVQITRKDWGNLVGRIELLEKAVEELTESLEGQPPC